jgi:hypothetical protein
MHSSDAKNNLQLMACLLQYELQLVFFPWLSPESELGWWVGTRLMKLPIDILN